LINQNADVSHRDRESRSALFYASRNGDQETVKMLIQAGARSDDGSLHEAAREAHLEIVSLMLSAGHDADFPSSLHSDGGYGRTALEELCLKAARRDGDGAWDTRLRETIGLLLPRQGNQMEKGGGKSILHLALDNEHALDVTEAFLGFPQVWKSINEPVHQYEDPAGFVYSATKYVEHFHRGPTGTVEKLDRLLREKRCHDRYYSRVGEQPEDGVGIPEDIAAEMARKRQLERESKEEMERLDALAARPQEIKIQNHQLELRMSTERHEQAMKHAQEANQLKLRFQSEEALHRQALQEADRDRELEHKKKLIMQNQAVEEARAERQKQLMWERDRVEKNQHDRQVRLIDRQETSMKVRASEARSVAEAAREANMPPDLLQLEDPD
jgi:hypothetical protein